MGAYVPNPQDPTQPTTAQLAGNMAYELQALKGYIQSLITSGTNFSYIGSFRNRLLNGNFNIAQRGTSVTVGAGTSSYTLDQWIVNNVAGTGSIVVSQSTSGVNSNTKSLQMVVPSGNTSMTLSNRIESYNCSDLVSGTSVTVSGFMQVSSLPATLPTISLVTPTVSDTFSTTTTVGAAVQMSINPQIAATFQFFSQTFVLSADATNGLGLVFSWPSSAAASLTINFARVQLEKGAQYTQFEYRPIQVELGLCERYYETSYNFNVTPGSATTPGISLVYLVGASNFSSGASTAHFKSLKRVIPTILLVSPVTGAANKVADLTNGVDVNGSTAVGQQSFFVTAIMSAPNTTINLEYHWTASAEL